MDNYNHKKVKQDKILLRMEIILGIATLIIYLILISIATIPNISNYISNIIIISSTIYLLIVCFILLKIEQIAGYYECHICHYKYIPTYKSVLWAMHIGRTRYMKCPKCDKKSWQRKRLNNS